MKPPRINVPRLNLGCGLRTHPDWVNVDFKAQTGGVIEHNLLLGLPFGDATFDAVYLSHLLEHFPKAYAPIFLKACFRVLRPGGIIRVVVPDLESIVRLYIEALEGSLRGEEQAQQRYEWIVLELFDQMVRSRPGGGMYEYWKQAQIPAEDFIIQRVGTEYLKARKAICRKNNVEHVSDSRRKQVEACSPGELGQFRLSGEIHQWMYDRYSLSVLLKKAGFKEVRKLAADESSIPGFNSYLLDIEADGSIRKPDSLFMEGTKNKD